MPAVSDETGRLMDAEDRSLESVWKGYTHFQEGDVLFAKITPCMENGKIALAEGLTNGLGCGTTEFHVLRPQGAAEPKLVWYYLRNKSFRLDAEKSMTGAVGQRRVPKSYLEDHVFHLPPLAEQKRIVSKLDALGEQRDTARAALDRISALVERCSGALLETSFNHVSGNSKVQLADICLSISDGDHQAPPKAESGVPFITISAMNDGNICLERATRYVPQSYYDSLDGKRSPKRGDILYSVTGSYGIAAPVNSKKAFVFQRHIGILKPDQKKVDKSFLLYFLRSPLAQRQADEVATGTAQKTVPLRGLREFCIPLPPLEEQREIVARIEAAFAEIDRLAAAATTARERLDRLDRAILAKAFRGELVPQDPNDEPASALLERIKAEQATKKPKAKTKRKTARKRKTP